MYVTAFAPFLQSDAVGLLKPHLSKSAKVYTGQRLAVTATIERIYIVSNKLGYSGLCDLRCMAAANMYNDQHNRQH